MPMEGYGIRELSARLMGIDAELKAELRPAVLEAADLIAEQAKGNASFSTKIPSQISAGANFSASGGGAEVRVKAGVYPHEAEARVLEGDGSVGEFRHPVYDHGGWAPQDTRPFLEPAVQAEHAAAVEIIRVAVLKAMTI